MTAKLFNNVTDTLSSPVGSTETTVTVSDGSKFTDPGAGNYTPCYFVRASDGAHEIVHIASVSGNELFVDRSQEGTDPLTFNAGDAVQIRPTRQSLLEMEASMMSVESTSGSYRPSSEWADGQVYTFSTLNDMASDEKLAVGQKVRTLGYYSPGDGGGNDYEIVPAGTGTDDGGSFIDLAGSGQQAKGLFPSGSVRAEHFGIVANYIKGEAVGVDQSSVLNRALSFAADNGYAEVLISPGLYNIGNTIVVPKRTALRCPGQYAQVDDDDVNLDGQVVLILTGAGPKTHKIEYDDVSGGFEMGGEVDNPSSGEPYTSTHGGRSDSYRLLDFTNGDASGADRATAKGFSVGVLLQAASSLEGVLITTNSNGNISVTDSNPTWGDDWDVGVWRLNADRSVMLGVSVWGYFRMAAELFTPIDNGDGYTPQAERAYSLNCSLRGYRALAIRSTTSYLCTGSDTDTVEIAWSASHRWPSSGEFQVSPGDAVYSYTGLSFAGDNLTFTGVTPSPSGVSAGDEIYRAGTNYGLAMSGWSGCYLRDIAHNSGRYSVDDYFGADAFSSQAGALEVSGRWVRQPVFDNSTLHCREDIGMFLHDCRDLVWNGGYIESRGAVDTVGNSIPRGTRIVALSEESSLHSAPYVVKGARELVFGTTVRLSQTMARPAFNIRNQGDNKFGSDNGLCDPENTWFGPTQMGLYGIGYGGTNNQVLGWHPRIPSPTGGYEGYLSSYRTDAIDSEDLPVGSIVPVYVGASANLESRRALRSIRLDADNANQYSIFGTGATLLGDWRCLGVCGKDGTDFYQSFQRVS